MNDLPPIDRGADGIEEGKRLMRVTGDGGLSLADRLTERFHRLAWRTPLHGLRLRGKYPLKLIAVPDDPFYGDPARGHALLDGMLSHHGETHNLHELHLANPGFSAGFADHLHSFAWLRDLSTVTTRVRGAPIAEQLMRDWLTAHADHVAGTAWRADLWGRRILFWTAHAPLILSSTDLVYRSRVLNTLARGARHIDRTADKAPAGAPRIAAWCGIVAAGLLIPGGDPRRSFGEAGLARALAGGVFDDGGSVGRSPVAQLDIIRCLTMLREAYSVRRLEAPAEQSAAIHRAVQALLGLMHGDGALSSWQGSGPMEAELLAQAIDATGVRTRPLRQAGEWGYQRLSAGKAVVIVDAAPPPIGRLGVGGCASTLAFELSDGPHRIVVNCGGARAIAAGVPAELAEGLRTTAAHSTLTVGDSNSTAIHGDGTLGKGVIEVALTRQESDAGSRIEASHDGYVRRQGLIHRRQIALSADGRDLRGEDSLLPAGKRRSRGETGFAVRFHLGASVQVAPTADGQAALLRLPGGAMWQFRARGGAIAIEPSLWIDGAGRPVATSQIVLTGMAPPGGASVSWLFHRAH